MAGLLTLCSALGYRSLAKDAGDNLGGGVRGAPKTKSS
jgi:hypothetical protein